MLGDANVIAELRTRAAEIDKAIIAESARWGDAQRPTSPYTKNDWERAVEGIVRWVTSRARGAGRRSEVLDQLRAVKWYPAVGTDAPTFSQDGGQVDAGFLLTVDASNGTIYYTTDGSDPRESGGAPSPLASSLETGGAVPISTGGWVKARVLVNDEWSPLTSARFFVEPLADLDSLHVSELHYNPGIPSAAEVAAGFDDKDRFEFIELVNVSDHTIDLTGARLERTTVDGNQRGVDFDFSTGGVAKLTPGERVLVVNDLAAFQLRYGLGLPIAGQWLGGLSNNSETVTLSAAGATLSFTYFDDWYGTTDGQGYSLEVGNEGYADPTVLSTSAGWRASFESGGSPGRPSILPGDSNHDGRFDSADLSAALQAGEYEDGVAKNSTFEEGDWDGDGDFTTLDIIYVFQSGFYQEAAAAIPNAALFSEPLGSDHGRLPRLKTQEDAASGDLEPIAAALATRLRDRVFAEF